jgi:hypothetical protein
MKMMIRLLFLDDFTVEVCVKLQRKIALKKKEKTGDGTKSTYSGILDGFYDKMRNWTTANQKLLAYLGQQWGVNGVPLRYVVKNEEERPEELDEVQDEIWNSPLSGTYFGNDNYTIYQILCQWTAEGVADTHVDRYSDSSDGQAAYQMLVATYEGDDARQTAIAKARSTITNAHYYRDSANFTFDDYCNKHLAANHELLRWKVPLDGSSQVTAFIPGIHRDVFQAIKSSIINYSTLVDDLHKTVAAFKRQI